jgi:hypothetical protein
VEVSNGLENFERRILLAVLNLIHVAVVDANFSGHILVRQSSFYTQLRNHCPKCSLWRVSLTFQHSDGTAHSGIFFGLTSLVLSAITLIMSWWVMITTAGKLLTNVHLEFVRDEIRLYEWRLQEGEQLAILLDTYHNVARIYAPFDECQRLASLHQYELYIKRQPEETFISHIEKLLTLRHPKIQKAGPPEGEPALGITRL